MICKGFSSHSYPASGWLIAQSYPSIISYTYGSCLNVHSWLPRSDTWIGFVILHAISLDPQADDKSPVLSILATDLQADRHITPEDIYTS